MEEFARCLLERIDSPSDPEIRALQQQALDEVEQVAAGEQIPNLTEDVVRRLTYTYYYDWETDEPDYLWLVQDPGNIHRRHLEELRVVNPLADGCSVRDQIGVYRNFGKSWLTGRNADFSEQVLTTLDDLGLITVGSDWESYLEEERFYQDVYLGDVVKYRTDGFGRDAERISYAEFLEGEIRELDPSLIFSFGGNAWSTVRREMNPEPLQPLNGDPGKMMDVHGCLHQVSSPIDTFVLPLSHMSGQVWWRFPPEDYIERMRDGLARWEALA